MFKDGSKAPASKSKTLISIIVLSAIHVLAVPLPAVVVLLKKVVVFKEEGV